MDKFQHEDYSFKNVDGKDYIMKFYKDIIKKEKYNVSFDTDKETYNVSFDIDFKTDTKEPVKQLTEEQQEILVLKKDLAEKDALIAELEKAMCKLME